MNEFKFITKNDMTKELFFKMPKSLMYEQKYKDLSANAKLLYSMLLDRTSLSIENNWFDEYDRAYIICEIDEVEIFLNCARGTANKSMKELEKYNLIMKKQQGQGKANLLYVAHVDTSNDTLKTHLQFHKRMLNALKVKRKEKKEEYKIKKSKICTPIENTKVDVTKDVQPLESPRCTKFEFNGVQDLDGNKTYSKDTEDVVVESTPDKIKLVKEYGFDINDIQTKLINNMDFDLLKDAVETTVAKCGNTFAYIYEVYNSLRNKNNTKSVVRTSNNSTMKPKTRYHQINQTFTKYDENELEQILLQSQKDKGMFKPSFSL